MSTVWVESEVYVTLTEGLLTLSISITPVLEVIEVIPRAELPKVFLVIIVQEVAAKGPVTTVIVAVDPLVSH